jgi:hypothetical protein
MSIQEHSNISISDSLSQGEDYSYLLNESPSQSWKFKQHKAQMTSTDRSSVKETLNYLEEDVNHLGEEVLKLRSQNCYLEAQIQVLEKEKEMHISAHAKEKMRLESLIKDLSSKFHNENKEQSKSLQLFRLKIQELESQLDEEKLKNKSISKKFQGKLEAKEKELMKIIRDKDKHIHQLQVQLEQGKCSRVCSFNPVHAMHKRSKSKKATSSLSKIITISNTVSNPMSYASKSESRLDSISNMIVKLEKEKADMNQTLSELDLSVGDKSKRSLHEMMTKNEERLKEAKAIQQSLLKEKFSI